MPITKIQDKNNRRIDAWLYDKHFQPNAKAKPEPVVLSPEEVHSTFTPIRSRELGAFFTPVEIADAAWHFISGYTYRPGDILKVLDPCAGLGILGAQGSNYQALNITAIEIDKQHHDIGKKLYPAWNWIHDNAFYVPIEANSFDLVIANPPYNVPTVAPDAFKSVKSEYRFLELALKALKPEGYGAFLAPYNFWEKRPKPLQALCDQNQVELIHQEKLGGGFSQTSVRVELFLFQKDA